MSLDDTSINKNPNVSAIILAGGEGTRMKSTLPKVLHRAEGRAMLDYVCDAARACGAKRLCVVIGAGADAVLEHAKAPDVEFSVQEKRLGTGHAVMCAEEFLKDLDGDVIVLYGDTPLLTGETLKKLLSFHHDQKNEASIISSVVENPFGYGRILRDKNGEFLKNVEQKDLLFNEQSIKEVNAGVYCFNAGALRLALSKLNNNNAAGEYYLPDCLEILKSEGLRVNAVDAPISEFFGVNSKAQLSEASALLRKRINLNHIENGVLIRDPQNTYISADAIIGEGTEILPGTLLEGEVIIGENCKIGPNSRISNTKIGNNTVIESSVVRDSKIGSSTNIGPFAYIRPDCVIGDEVKIGDFVEVKNSVVGNGTKVSHLTYIGDTDAGERINFGCGTVTVNYDGKKKYRTIIEDDAFIGCNANLISPVHIGKGAYIAAGSTINKDVPAKGLSIARARQMNIDDGRKGLGL